MKCLSLLVKIIVDFVVDDFSFIHSTLSAFFPFVSLNRSFVHVRFVLILYTFFCGSWFVRLLSYSFFHHLFYYNHPTVHNPSIDLNPCSICQFLYFTFPSYPEQANFSYISLQNLANHLHELGQLEGWPAFSHINAFYTSRVNSMKAGQLEHARTLLTGKGVKLSPYINAR